MSITAEHPAALEETAGAPTEPIDYAAINAVFFGLLAAIAAAARSGPERTAAAVDRRDLPMVALATFSLSKVIARERIGVWMREPFVERVDGQRRPRGRRLRHAVGELVTCTRCVGAWSAAGLVGLRIADPQAGRVVTGVLAASGANDFLQAAFRMLAEGSNVVQEKARS